MIKNYMFLVLFQLGGFILQSHQAVGGDVSVTDGTFGPPEIRERIEFTISGTVTSETGEVMPGVNVLEKGSNNGAVTDSNGKYAITTSSGDAILVFSFIGYTTQEVSIANRATVDMSMKVDLTTLEEVVVVGYGTQEKRDVTGATATVKADEIIKRPITRVEQALQGTTPGVVVSSNSGQPGNPLSVRIRGSNSITGSNEPLYVIDGYIGGNIETINPNDIESLEILKDASATAIYGSRGSNGVVIITTKTGKTGETKINFGTWFSKASIPKQLNIMNAYQFATTVNTQYALTDPSSTDKFTNAQLENFRVNGGTNWQKELQVKPWIKNYQLDVSGGSDNVRYLFSFNQLDQPGLILNQYYKRTTFRTNVDVKLNKKLDVGFKVVAMMPQSRNTSYQGDLTDPFSEANIWDPTSPIRDPVTGQYIKSSKYGSKGFNPIAQANNQLDDNRTTSLTGIGTLTYRIFKDLIFTSINSYEIQSQLTQSLRGTETSNGISGSDYASATSNRYRAYQNSNFLTYNHKFGEHAITVTALYEQQNKLNEGVTARSVNLSTYSLGYYNLSLGSTQQTSSSYWADALQSYMGRANYSYRNRYLLTASVRTDGSSHLTDKYSTFPSVAAGWNLANESFLANSSLFSQLKLRGSWGKTGNQAVGPYSTIAQINTGGPHPSYYFDGTTPSVATPLGSPVSPSLKWETTEQVDIGLDASFLENRLTFTADVYKKKITDLLYNYQAPFYMGGGSYARNIGTIENKGLELSLKAIPVNTRGITWNSFFTISFNRNKVVDLGGLNNISVNNIGSAQTGASMLRVGRPLGEFYGYQFLGTWKTSEAAAAAAYGNKPGDAKYLDVNGDHTFNASDYLPLGNATPKYSYGFINDISYKEFTLSFMFQGQQGSQVFSQTLAYLWGGLGDMKNATTTEAVPENLWSPSHETDNPAWSNTGHNYNGSSRYVYNSSYTKLKNLSLTYRVPASVANRLKLNSLEVYVSGQNLWVITPYKGYDPEVDNQPTGNAISQGQEFGVIPNPKGYTFGLRLSL